MKNKNQFVFFLLLIFSIGLLFRLWQVQKIPVSLGNDEISIAYDAYSIGEIGKDQYGNDFPLSFRSHNTYKAPLLIYITSVFVKIFGNNELSVRLPSVILGSLTVVFLMLLVYRLTTNKLLSLNSGFLLAVAPWHVYTSRISLESNVALFFLVVGVYFFILATSKTSFLLPSMIAFVLSVYSYHTEWVFTPLVIAFVTILFFKDFKNKITLFANVILFFLLVSPLFFQYYFGGNLSSRAETEIIFQDFLLKNRLEGIHNIATKIIIVGTFWAGKYFDYLNPSYLFIRGLKITPDFGAPELGLLNIVQIPLFVIGLIFLIKGKDRKFKLFTIGLLLLSPLVPSLTGGETNLVRNLVSVIPLTIVSANGLLWIYEKIKFKYVFGFAILFIFSNFLFFYHFYIKIFPVYFAENWSYGYKQMANYIKTNESKYQNIVIDPRFGTGGYTFIGVPSLYILYFNEHDPEVYLTQKKNLEGKFVFLKYEIRQIDWTMEEVVPSTLYISYPANHPTVNQKVEKVYKVDYPDGQTAFDFYKGI